MFRHMHGVLNEIYLQNFLHKRAGARAVFRGAGALSNEPEIHREQLVQARLQAHGRLQTFFPTFILFSIFVVPTFFPKNDSEYYA